VRSLQDRWLADRQQCRISVGMWKRYVTIVAPTRFISRSRIRWLL
jgi:hypothetical protein